MDKTSMTLGCLVGRQIAGQRRKPPVAYLYNSLRLPALPEYDKTAYPYAIIFAYQVSLSDTTLAYTLFLLNQPATVGKMASNYLRSGGGSVAEYRIVGTGNEWQIERVIDTTSGGYIASTGSNPWSNYDLYNEDGKTLYLAKSDPIPVYE